MRVVIQAVGKVKPAPFREVLDDYLGRLRHYVKCDETELRDGTATEVEARFARVDAARSRVVALAVEGYPWSSARLARFVGQCEQDAVPTLVFRIGGADGLPSSICRQADVRLSLSSLTLPHRLARVVLAEQLYRAYTILRGEPYSR